MIGMQFVWAGMSLEIGTIGWQGQSGDKHASAMDSRD